MVKEQYVAPELGSEAFNCPFCGSYSHQIWNEAKYQLVEATPLINVGPYSPGTTGMIRGMPIKYNHISYFSFCFKCKEIAIWRDSNLIYPNNAIAEPPNPDMPESIRDLYNEARLICRLSAKSAAALLRLAVEKLLVHVGAKKGSIDAMIQSLIDQEVISHSGSVRKALDSIRLIGNAGVHPTAINLDEDPNAAFALFKVLNFVVEKLISDEKEMESIYALVPEDKRDKLDKRRGE